MVKLTTYDYRGVSRVGVYVGEKIAHIARLTGDRRSVKKRNLVEAKTNLPLELNCRTK